MQVATDMEDTRQRWTEPRYKIIGVPLEKSMQRDEDGTLTVRGFFTSDNRDELGDIITRAATERAIEKYRRWGNIRYMHQPKPVGKISRIGTADGLEWNEVEIKVIDPTAVWEVEQGLLTALSVGILINFEDIEFQEDGGLIINDYVLAEISLVDHPANYDAILTSVKDLMASIATVRGKDVVLRQLDDIKSALTDTELVMEEELIKTDAIETEPAEEQEVEPVEKAVEVDDPEAETPVVVENRAVEPEGADAPEGEPEAEVAPEVVEEEKTIEAEETQPEADEPVEEPQPAEEQEPVTPEAEQKSLEDIVNDLAETVRSLVEAVAEIRKSLEAPAEAPLAEEQAQGEGDAVKEAAVSPVGEVEEPVQPGTPAERKGGMPETDLPDEVKTVGEPEEEPVTDLRQALHKYFETRRK